MPLHMKNSITLFRIPAIWLIFICNDFETLYTTRPQCPTRNSSTRAVAKNIHVNHHTSKWYSPSNVVLYICKYAFVLRTVQLLRMQILIYILKTIVLNLFEMQTQNFQREKRGVRDSKVHVNGTWGLEAVIMICYPCIHKIYTYWR